LLGSVLGLPWDSPAVRALMEGAGIMLLNDFLLYPPPTIKKSLLMWKHKHMVVLSSKNSILLISTFLWCSSGGASHVSGAIICLPGLRTTRANFLHFLEDVLWKTREVPQFSFPVVGVLPGTLFRVLSRPPVPVQVLPPVQLNIGLNNEEQVLSGQESFLEVLSVLQASPDVF